MNYELEITNYIDGGLAQLVERLLCKQDVSGSSPLISTLCKNRKKNHIVDCRTRQKIDIIIFVVISTV